MTDQPLPRPKPFSQQPPPHTRSAVRYLSKGRDNAGDGTSIAKAALKPRVPPVLTSTGALVEPETVPF